MSMIPFGNRAAEKDPEKDLPPLSPLDPFIAVAVLLAAILAIILTCSGCVAPGCVAVIDIDLRTPEQIKASQAYDCAVFTGLAQINPEQDSKAVPPSVWAALFKMITDIEGRIRVGYIAWGASPSKETTNEATSRGRR